MAVGRDITVNCELAGSSFGVSRQSNGPTEAVVLGHAFQDSRRIVPYNSRFINEQRISSEEVVRAYCEKTRHDNVMPSNGKGNILKERGSRQGLE